MCGSCECMLVNRSVADEQSSSALVSRERVLAHCLDGDSRLVDPHLRLCLFGRRGQLENDMESGRGSADGMLGQFTLQAPDEQVSAASVDTAHAAEMSVELGSAHEVGEGELF